MKDIILSDGVCGDGSKDLNKSESERVLVEFLKNHYPHLLRREPRIESDNLRTITVTVKAEGLEEIKAQFDELRKMMDEMQIQVDEIVKQISFARRKLGKEIL